MQTAGPNTVSGHSITAIDTHHAYLKTRPGITGRATRCAGFSWHHLAARRLDDLQGDRRLYDNIVVLPHRLIHILFRDFTMP